MTATLSDRLNATCSRVYDAHELVSLAARITYDNVGDVPESLQGLPELLDATKDKLAGLDDEIRMAGVAAEAAA